jgi:hypothetical protein
MPKIAPTVRAPPQENAATGGSIRPAPACAGGAREHIAVLEIRARPCN